MAPAFVLLEPREGRKKSWEIFSFSDKDAQKRDNDTHTLGIGGNQTQGFVRTKQELHH